MVQVMNTFVTNPWDGTQDASTAGVTAKTGSGLTACREALKSLNFILKIIINSNKKNSECLSDDGVLLSIGKCPQGYPRRGEFRAESYRKIQRHLSLGSSVTMASGGGPRSWRPISVSCALILRLSTLSCSNCFTSNYWADYFFILWDQLSDLINSTADLEHMGGEGGSF